jgi:hypothetical protein
MDAQSPSAHTSGRLGQRDVSTFVLLDGQAGHDRVGNNPRDQDDRIRFNRSVGQMDLSRLDGSHTGVGLNGHPGPLTEHPGSIVPGCPELAACTASIASVRIVLIHIVSSAVA